MTYADAAAHLARVVGRVIDELEAQGAELPADLARWRSPSSDHFAAHHTPAHDSVERYRQDLEDAYGEWADDAAAQLAAEKDSVKREALLAVLLALLLTRLTVVAHAELPGAVAEALGGTAANPAIYAKLAEMMGQTDAYLSGTFIPAVESRVQSALADAETLQLIAAGQIESVTVALKGYLVKLTARVGGLAGDFWQMVQWAIGLAADEQNYTIKAYLAANAQHCDDCPQFHSVEGTEYANFQAYLDTTGGRVPGEFACRSGCRCSLQFGDKTTITAQTA